jgi:hypothetical protein
MYIQKTSSLPSGSERTRLDDILGLHGSKDGEVVSSSLLNKRPWPHLASNFSSKVSSWFIDDSSEETSSSSCESEESSSPPSLSESHSLFLIIEDSASSSNLHLPLLSLDAILRRRESLERERVIDRSSLYSRHRWHIRRDALVMGRSASNS